MFYYYLEDAFLPVIFAGSHKQAVGEGNVKKAILILAAEHWGPTACSQGLRTCNIMRLNTSVFGNPFDPGGVSCKHPPAAALPA
jgi:hypothetical protein